MYERHCPNCKSDQRGKLIPEEYIKNGMYGDATHYYRTIGVYDIKKDRTVSWKCPDCGYEWERK